LPKYYRNFQAQGSLFDETLERSKDTEGEIRNYVETLRLNTENTGTGFSVRILFFL